MNPKIARAIEAQTDHAIFGPSKWDRLLTCPGSLVASIDRPDGGGAAADEGTAAHWVHERILLDLPIGDEAPNGVKITEDMLDHVQDSVTRIRALHAQHGGDLLVEQRFDLSAWTPVPRQFGTSDVVIAANGTLVVVDLKYGMGEVDVDETSQNIAYALGAMDALDWLYDFQTIITAIHQPRLGQFRQSTFTRDELLAEGASAKSRLARCLDDEPALTPSVKGCKYCPALSDCPAVARQTAALIDATFDEVADPVAQALAWRPIAEAFFKAAEAKALETFKAGGDVPGWKPVEGVTRRRWRDETAVVNLLGDEAWEKKLVTPSAAEKIAKKAGATREQIAEMMQNTEKPRGKVQIALVSDKRPRYDGDFSDSFDEE